MRVVWVVTGAVVLSAGLGLSPAWAKTPKECNAEYAANKAAIKGAGQKKKDFIAACKTDSETIPGGTAAAPAAPTPAPTTTAAPAPTAAPTRTASVQPRMAPTAPSGANEFTTEAQATSHCPSQTVVWLNTKSKVYHFAGSKNYGNTKSGAYMCEADATSAGDRAAKNEKHP